MSKWRDGYEVRSHLGSVLSDEKRAVGISVRNAMSMSEVYLKYPISTYIIFFIAAVFHACIDSSLGTVYTSI